MRKAIKDAKWYWFIPTVWLFVLPQLAKWILDPEENSVRMSRYILSLYLMFPTVIILFYFIGKLMKLVL